MIEDNQPNGQTRPALAGPGFVNEPPADFALSDARQKMDLALQQVQKQFGQHFPLVINGKKLSTDSELPSVNPAKPDEVVGRNAAGNSVNAMDAVAAARIAFSRWSQTPFAVELPDDDRIALAQMVEHAVQLRPVPTPAGGGLFEQASATGGPERLRLQGVVLFVPLGDAGVAEQCAAPDGLGLSQTTVCEWIWRARQFLANLLSISCCRIALKGKRFMNGLPPPTGARYAASHPVVFRATNPVVRDPDRCTPR